MHIYTYADTTVHMCAYMKSTDAEEVQESCNSPNETSGVIGQLMDVVKGVMRNSALMEVLEPQVTKLLGITWSLHSHLVKIAGH